MSYRQVTGCISLMKRDRYSLEPQKKTLSYLNVIYQGIERAVIDVFFNLTTFKIITNIEYDHVAINILEWVYLFVYM